MSDVVLVARVIGLLMLSVFCGDHIYQCWQLAHEAPKVGFSKTKYISRGAVFAGLSITNSVLITGILASRYYPAALDEIRIAFFANSVLVFVTLIWHYYLRLK